MSDLIGEIDEADIPFDVKDLPSGSAENMPKP